MHLMAGWLYIIKQATGDVPGGTTPAKTHSLNTMFQKAITHRVPGEEHPDERLQLSLCLSCPAAFWFPCRRLPLLYWSWGLRVLYPPCDCELHCPSWVQGCCFHYR